MEQITSIDGDIYYGRSRCKNADEAYRKFRSDLQLELKNRDNRRLNAFSRRKERIHGYGIDFDPGRSGDLEKLFGHLGKVRYRIIGMMGASYCRIVGLWDMPRIQEEVFEEYIDYLFDRRSHALRLVSRRDRTGRTSKLINKRYR